MASSAAVTAVQRALARRRRYTWPLVAFAALVFVVGAVVIIIGVVAVARFSGSSTPRYAHIEDHFKYGSIGSEPESGLPYRVWQALPRLFPAEFEGRSDYRAFGFLYETDEQGRQRDLPVGVSRRQVNGVDVVWLNCAVCHTGTVRQTPADEPNKILGMPANNLDLYRFSQFILGLAGDERMNPDILLPALDEVGADLDWLDRLAWRFAVLPRLREGLVQRSARLSPLLQEQPAWGPGRVDTFNPYKVLVFGRKAGELSRQERVGVADFPSIYHQRPRGEQNMELHWDGNNPSLQERNLSAAIGAGVTEETVDHAAIERVAEWLLDLSPPPSPYRQNPALISRGRDIYMKACADCHGYQSSEGYVFEGDILGQVQPIASIGTDPARLNSYTTELRNHQLTLFASEPRYHFRHFRKTDGYANHPLDGLWLRGPYLHNGSVPTLSDLLQPAEERPVAFVRGLDVLDENSGGFAAPPCDPASYDGPAFCFDTRLPGNGNQGHEYGTDLAEEEKAALLAYLLTF